MILVVVGPYAVILGLAAYDRLMLKLNGHERPASPAWALLTELGYLIVRGMRTSKETGKGYAPLTVFAGALGLLLAAVIALPGLVMAMFPAAVLERGRSHRGRQRRGARRRTRGGLPRPAAAHRRELHLHRDQAERQLRLDLRESAAHQRLDRLAGRRLGCLGAHRPVDGRARHFSATKKAGAGLLAHYQRVNIVETPL